MPATHKRAPSEAASDFKVGTQKQGADGRTYKVVTYKRWVLAEAAAPHSKRRSATPTKTKKRRTSRTARTSRTSRTSRTPTPTRAQPAPPARGKKTAYTLEAAREWLKSRKDIRGTKLLFAGKTAQGNPSRKWWAIHLDGDQVTTSYGSVGSTGRSTVSYPPQPAVHVVQMVQQKLQKGYQGIASKGEKERFWSTEL